MRVLGLVPGPYDTIPGQRYRIEQWERMLREQGIRIDFVPFASPQLQRTLYTSANHLKKSALLARDFFKRWSTIDLARNYDLIYIYREAALIGPPWIEHRLARMAVPIVFDFDDAIFLRSPSGANKRLSFLKCSTSKTRTICRLATHVIVGNEYLASYARQYASDVTVIPTTIDVDHYVSPRVKPQNDVPVLGWTGSHSTIVHLDIIRTALQRLAEERRFRLRVIGVPGYTVDGVDVESLTWSSETEVSDLSVIDIGLMPLADDDWCKGKCGCKALQYMALAIPSICSPVGVNCDIIQHGENGLHASTEEQWVSQLRLLIDSTQLRQRLGGAGRRTVESKYSARNAAQRLSQVFEATLNLSYSSKNSLVSPQGAAPEGRNTA